jgi:phage gpG-like protein
MTLSADRLGYLIFVKSHELGKVNTELMRWVKNFENTSELMDSIAALMEAQTKRRIADTKTAPDGSRWKAWSPEYAKTRSPKHSLNIDTQNLLDSIAGQADARGARVGTNVAYSKYVQARRPFIGLADEDVVEITEMLSDWMKDVTA